MNTQTKFMLPIFVLFLFSITLISAQESQTICGVYFTGIGCPHCASADPKIIQEFPQKHPNYVVIEYEIYQTSENGKILNQYTENSNTPSGIPQMRIENEMEIGERSSGEGPTTTWTKEKIETLDYAKCPFSNGSTQFFEKLNLNSLPGKPKIWANERVLIKTNSIDTKNGTITTWKLGWNNDYKIYENQYLNESDIKQLLYSNIDTKINQINYEKLNQLTVPLSGKNIIFENAIEFNVTSEKIQSSQEKLTLAKLISLALVDAVNPCALAVLTLMLIAILTYNPKDRKQLLSAGLAFATSVFIMYLIYGLIIIKSFQLIQALTSVRLILYKILGGIAIVLGVLNIRDFFIYKPGTIGTEMPMGLRPKMKKMVSKVTSPKGAFVIGLFVTLFLLPCTIGPYIIAGGILSASALIETIPPLLLYNLIFVLPMITLSFFVYRGFAKVEDISGWKDKNIKKLHLFAGIIMIVLGISMILGLV